MHCYKKEKPNMVQSGPMKNGFAIWNRLRSVRSFTVLLVLLAVMLVATILSPVFIRPANLVNVIRQISINGILAIGMTFVLLTGGIDLSVGTTMGVVAVVVATMFKSGLPPAAAVPVALSIGITIGLINGLGVTKGGITPFIMTLSTLTAFRGAALLIANGQPISWRNAGINFRFLGQGDILGIPIPVFVFLTVFFLTFVILKYTYFGRSVFAIGDSREAARLSGINVFRTELFVYILAGFLASLSALVLISRLSVGEPTAGENYELDAIAMSVIGGTSTAGGVGGVVGTLIGASLLSVIQNLLNIIGVSPFVQRIVKGIIIFVAVLMDSKNKKK
jgi:ribose transport system permease protein